ncbi:radical SAM family heme chaperone HemW [Dongia sedimenti]|uniref:Heme chaperone HemW n=1 Tax=Dongia sedimenti TaxID=3064282 RepID=A0ABU0YN52_9PROT|nr:radical SAM family heme chaperone HemW [Rhodospirillaceae bacterium R-7]
MTPDDRGFGIYVHWPFCRAKCPYCDFNSHVREAIDQRRWRDALLKELSHYAAQTPGRTVTSLFFGGGTPSLMEPETAAAVIDTVRTHWTTAPNLEITLEANPTSVEIGRFRAFSDAGVNRVSIGVQALDDAVLQFLGRQHSAGEAIRALEIGRATFPRLSFDLIYARPGQSLEAWQSELAAALDLANSHISLYQLTIEPGTAFEQRVARGDFQVLPEEEQAVLFDWTAARLERAGMPAYEISNHARPGEESRHNLTYWRYGDYVGIGPGAHGRLTLDGRKLATRQHRAPEAWLEAVERAGHATRQRDEVESAARLQELVMMGLRLAEGIPAARFVAETGFDIEGALDAQRLKRMTEGGFLTLENDRLTATSEGRTRLDAVLGALLA